MRYDVIIIGGGPSGMTAGIYVQRAGKKALILDGSSYGGQIAVTDAIENYPGIKKISGAEFAETLYRQVTELGAEFINENAEEIKTLSSGKDKYFQVKTSDKTFEGQAVIIATGVKKRLLNIEGEEKFTGSGVSYCATCDGNFFRGKDVAVIGGGNTALGDAEVLSEIANKVYLIHRRQEFRGDKRTVARLENKKNVEFVLDAIPVSIDGGFVVDGLKVKNIKTENETKIPVNGIFVAVGNVPDNDKFKNIVDLDKAGYVEAGENCLTKTPGIFVAGDCRKKNVRQLSTATSDGSVAALAAIEYINEQ